MRYVPDITTSMRQTAFVHRVRARCALLLAILFAVIDLPAAAEPITAGFAVELPASAPRAAEPLHGRVFLLLSKDPSAEPRLQIGHTPASQIVFGMNVGAWTPGMRVRVDATAAGYPVPSLADVPPGTYRVQALLNRYETFHRGDGHTVDLPPDKGEGQQWSIKPGNLYSRPRDIAIGAGGRVVGGPAVLALTETVPPIPTPADTPYVRHISVESKVLSAFWGRPTTISAIVLVPEGFDSHPDARYPLIVNHDHFVADFTEFRTSAPDPDLKPDYSERFHLAGYNRIQQEEAYAFYRQWTAPNFPRVLIVKVQHANPYYDDSYAVDSANVGPYGTAIETELIPAIEQRFRGIGQGWARFTYGGSTGGWEALAVQIFHPDFYNGAFGACPDPVDFHAYTHIDLYADDNAIWLQGANKRVAQPAMRDYLGHTTLSLPDNQAYELALGDHGRSGEQWDIWQAVYSPVGADGYPQPIFDKRTGVIDHKVAEHWRTHWDLTEYVRSHWATIGPQLQGKLHIYVGNDDSYFLNDAVYRMQAMLEALRAPAYGGEVRYGDRAEHCWNGDPTQPNALSRLHYHTQYMPQIVERMERTAPEGADLTSWRY